jgi:hypothetical protein
VMVSRTAALHLPSACLLAEFGDPIR